MKKIISKSKPVVKKTFISDRVNKEDGYTTIYIGNLAYEIKESDIKKIFSRYGEVTYTRLMQNLEKKLSLGFAFVQMPDRECAKKAILELNGKEMNGRTLKVSIANDKEAKRARKLQKLKGKDPRQKKC